MQLCFDSHSSALSAAGLIGRRAPVYSHIGIVALGHSTQACMHSSPPYSLSLRGPSQAVNATDVPFQTLLQVLNTLQDEIIIVDEFTGRTMPGRRWGDGLHQAVEAKEGLPIQDETVTLASISYQVQTFKRNPDIGKTPACS